MSGPLVDLAAQVIATAVAMNERGINHGTSGNVSARVDDGDGGGIVITPSGRPYDRLEPGDLIHLRPDTTWTTVGTDREPGLRPSSEWRFHLDILAARDDAGAVVHAHPTAATALAIHGRGIGPVHYMVGIAGGHDIRCAPYATFGTPELSANALAALHGRRACLLAHHGSIAIGPDLDSALAVAVEVEVVAAQYLAALALGEPPELTPAQMDAVLDKMASPDGYGSSPEVTTDGE
ncbi:MAG: class II aldolase/adducin family protein [Actinomycetota bacterium]